MVASKHKMMSEFFEFETERLLLRPTRIADAPFIYKLFNTPKWLKYIGDRNIKSVEAAATYIKHKMLPQLERLGYSSYTVIRKSDQEYIGTCGLYDREGLEGIDIGFAFLPEFEGQGFGYEAAIQLKEVAFQQFGLKKINAITGKENLASQKLLRKIGLQYVGVTKVGEEAEEVLFYSLER